MATRELAAGAAQNRSNRAAAVTAPRRAVCRMSLQLFSTMVGILHNLGQVLAGSNVDCMSTPRGIAAGWSLVNVQNPFQHSDNTRMN